MRFIFLLIYSGITGNILENSGANVDSDSSVAGTLELPDKNVEYSFSVGSRDFSL